MNLDTTTTSNDTVVINSSIKNLNLVVEVPTITPVESRTNSPKIDTFITVLTTLCVFTLGIIYTRFNEKRKRKKELKLKRDLLHFYIEKLVSKYLPAITNSYREYVVEFYSSKKLNLTEPKMLSNDLERILKLEDYDLMKSINLKEATLLFDEVDSVKAIIPIIEKFHSEIRKELDERFEVARNHHFELKAEFAMLKSHYSKESQLFIELSKILIDRIVAVNQANQATANIELLEQYLKVWNKNKAVFDLIDFNNHERLISETIANLNSILIIFDGCKEDFEGYIDFLETTHSTMKSLIKKINWN